MKRDDIAAALITAAVAALLLVVLCAAKLSFDPDMWKQEPRQTTEMMEVEEEFVDLFDPAVVRANPQPAYAENKVNKESTPAPAEGSDLVNAGEAAAPVPDVTSERPSPVTRPKKENPPVAGPDKKAQEAEKARREAQKGVSNAFKSTQEPADNTASKGTEKGDSGSPDGAASDLNGTGQGTVGGGWIMPSYAKVKAYQTGSIELRATVDREGNVKSVQLTGGKAPASGDPALVARCIAEVKRHRFTRTDNNAPESATARITYTFR